MYRSLLVLLLLSSSISLVSSAQAQNQQGGKVQQSLQDHLGCDDLLLPEDMQIRQMLKKRVDGKSDSEYQAIFERRPRWPARGSSSPSSRSWSGKIIPLRSKRVGFDELYGESAQSHRISLSEYLSKDLEPGAKMLEEGDYDRAETFLKNFDFISSRQYLHARYLQGLLFQATGKFREAKKQYELVENTSDEILRSKAQLGIRAVQDKRRKIEQEQLHFPSLIRNPDESIKHLL